MFLGDRGGASLSFLSPEARAFGLERDSVVHDPVDGGGRGHRILEDLIPLREHQVRCDHDALALVAFGEQRKEHLHLRPVLLNVSDVIERQALEAVKALQLPRQAHVALGGEEFLHRGGDGGLEHRQAALDEGAGDRGRCAAVD